jgi:hypothetical protein
VSTGAGLAPNSVGLEVRLGRVGRENASTKADRLLVAGAVMVRRLDDQGVLAYVRGDSGAVRTVIHEAGLWSCDCEAGTRCSHLRAVQKVVAVDQEGGRA